MTSIQGQASPLFINFNASKAEDKRAATTLALGEEGGEASTRAFGEEGGAVTSFSLGEEGGDVTTFAVGEEGGTANSLITTSDAIRGLKVADKNKDGVVSSEELKETETVLGGRIEKASAQAEYANQVVGVLQVWNLFFGGFLGGLLNQWQDYADKVQNDLSLMNKDNTAVKFLDEHFTVIAAADQTGAPPPAGQDPTRTISELDIKNVAKRDGIQNSISEKDLKQQFLLQ